jgi:DNA-binding transcriptional LysR family regulator
MRADLLTLKLFVSVYEEMSIAKAAEREHIAPSALSKRLSDLEASIGTLLFHRLRNGLDATPAADALLRHARLIMREVKQMESELNDFTAGLKGYVRIWSNIWGIIQYLPNDLASFLAAHEKVHIDLREQISSVTFRAVEENAADIGIVVGDITVPGLTLVPYRSDSLVVVMRSDHSLAAQTKLKLRDLMPYELVGQRPDSALEKLLIRAAAEFGETLRPRISVTGFEAVCRMAEANLGIGLVPAQCAARYLPAMNIKAIPLDETWGTRTLNICFNSLESLPATARLLVRHLALSGSQSTMPPC